MLPTHASQPLLERPGGRTRREPRGRWLLVAALLASGFGLAPAAPAVTTNVPCTVTALVAAINAANGTPADDTLSLAAGCVYALTVADNATAGGNGLPVILNAATSGRLTLSGHGARLARGFRLLLPLVLGAVGKSQAAAVAANPLAPGRASVAGDFRILMVASGGNLTLQDVTVENGSLPGNNGGGILNAGTLAVANTTLSGNVAAFGGGIYNSGTLTVTSSAFSANTADGAGGGINSVGALTVSGSAFAGNTAGLGDGILVAAGTSSVTTTTFSGDTAFTCPAFPHTVAAGDTAGLISSLSCANSSPSSDVIDLTNSTYSLAAPDNTTDGPTGLPIIVDAATGGTLTVNGNGATIARSSAGGTPEFRLMVVEVGGNLALDNVTLQNGLLSDNIGGGIFNLGTLALTNSHLTGNGAILGGGIHNCCTAQVAGSVTISNSVFTHNAASSAGGGLANFGGTVTISNSSFVSNTAQDDGGGLSSSGATRVSNSTFTDNLAAYGGGLSGRPGGALTIVNSNFLTNTTHHDGGGLNSGGTLQLFGSLFRHNLAGDVFDGSSGLGGGAVIFNGPATITTTSFISNSAYGAASGGGLIVGGTIAISDTTIAQNYGDGAGGGLFVVDGNVRVTNTTIVSNTSTANGGGIYNHGTLLVTHSTIAGNATSQSGYFLDGGGGIVVTGGTVTLGSTIVADNTGSPGPDITGTVISLGYNIIGDTTNVTLTGTTTGNLTGLAAAPLNLGPLQNNGGPTLTMALLTGSVAIDAGDPAFSPPPAFDQRGPGFPRVHNGVMDIGAFEK